jgi:hypothetical protein
MKLDPGMHIGMHLVSFGKIGRDRESHPQGSPAPPPTAVHLPRKGCARKTEGHTPTCDVPHTKRRW